MKYYAKCAVRFKHSNALKRMIWTLEVENFGKYDFQLLGNPISVDPANIASSYMRWNWLIKNWRIRLKTSKTVDDLYTQLATALSGAEN